MNAPTLEHCNLCKRNVFVCASCGKPSCIGGRTACPGCVEARTLDDEAHAAQEASGSAS